MINDVATNHICRNSKKVKLEAMFWNILIGNDCLIEAIQVINFSLSYTVWKFHNFPATEILREIIFWEFAASKYATLAILKVVNIDFKTFQP